RPPAAPPSEALHPEHREIAMPPRFDVAHGHPPQLADVAQVLGNAQVVVQAERLRKITNVRARLPGRLTQQLRGAGCRLHDAAQDLERRGLPGALWSDECEDLRALRVE